MFPCASVGSTRAPLSTSDALVQDIHQTDVRFFSPPPSPLKNSFLEPETFAKSPFIIGVAGGTASGKVRCVASTVVLLILKGIGASVLSCK